MRTLFLDLASNHQLIALVDGERTLASAAIESRTGEEHLLPLIESMLMNAGKTFKDLGRIATTTGPGGFMSLRVGIALANALSDSLGIPLAGVHLSDVWRARLPHPNPPPPIRRAQGKRGEGVLWLHSTKKEYLFVRGFGDLEKKWPEPVLISVEDLQRSLSLLGGEGQGVGVVGELIESQQAMLPYAKPAEHLPNIEEILPALLAALRYEKKSLLPWYGRGA